MIPPRCLPRLCAAALACAAAAEAQSPPQAVLPTVVQAAPAVPCETCPPAPAAACVACQPCGGFDWFKLPAPTAFPKPGYFPNPPAGEGYFSLADQLRDEQRKAPPKYGYPRFALMPPSFFDADWRYLEDPKNPVERNFSEKLKRIPLGECWRLSTGGSSWTRFMSETNSRLTSVENEYTLSRLRGYFDVQYMDNFRVFGEALGAWSAGEDLAPLAIDENYADILNLFVEFKAFEIDNTPVHVRIGRQELLLGSQRLVSTLEWANTRRTFDGVRAYTRSEKVDVDVFWTQPVIVNRTELDSRDEQQHFGGLWATFKPKKDVAIDGYYLLYDNGNNATQQGIVRAPTTRHTLGSRLYGSTEDGFLYEGEAAVQFGSQAGKEVLAGMASAGIGRHFKKAPLTPTAWLYFDHASGDNSPNDGSQRTFHQLFPFGHYYMGWADLVGRQNLNDINGHLYFYPTKWTTVWLQYHHLWLANSKDALYNAGGVATRRDPTGRAGSAVGNEIDVVANFHLTKQWDLLVGHSHLIGGGFLRDTAGPTGEKNASVTFVQANYRW